MMEVMELEKALAASQRETSEAQETAKKAAVEMQASLEAAQAARKQAEEVSSTICHLTLTLPFVTFL